MGLKCYDFVVFFPFFFFTFVVRVEVMVSCGFIYPRLNMNLSLGLNSICSVLSFAKMVS